MLQNKFYFLINIIFFFPTALNSLFGVDDLLDQEHKVTTKALSSEISTNNIGSNICSSNVFSIVRTVYNSITIT